MVVRSPQEGLNAVVFPMPASRFVNVVIRGVFIRNNPDVVVYDMSGNPVNTRVFKRNNFVRIDVSNLQSGMYLVSVTDVTTGASVVKQIVVRN